MLNVIHLAAELIAIAAAANTVAQAARQHIPRCPPRLASAATWGPPASNVATVYVFDGDALHADDKG